MAQRHKAHTIYRQKSGKRVCSSTTYTKELGWGTDALIRWANNLGLEGVDSNNLVGEAARAGTLAHLMVTENRLQKKKINTDAYSKIEIDMALKAMESYDNWASKHIIKPIWIEEPKTSELWPYGGTLDIYAEIDGLLVLLDLKTGKGVYAEHYIQVASYKKLLEEYGKKVEKVFILNIPRKKGEKFACPDVTEYMSDSWEVFKCNMITYRLHKKLR